MGPLGDRAELDVRSFLAGSRFGDSAPSDDSLWMGLRARYHEPAC